MNIEYYRPLLDSIVGLQTPILHHLLILLSLEALTIFQPYCPRNGSVACAPKKINMLLYYILQDLHVHEVLRQQPT